MNWVDWVILAIAASSVFAGLMDGLVKTVLSFASVIVAFFVASRFSLPVGTFLAKWLSAGIAHPAGFIVVFLLVMIAFGLITWLLRSTLEKLALTWIDRLFGAVLGFFRAAAVLGLLAVFIQGFGSFSATRASKTFPYAVKSGDFLLKAVPPSWKSHLHWKHAESSTPHSPGSGGKSSGKDGDVI